MSRIRVIRPKMGMTMTEGSTSENVAINAPGMPAAWKPA